MALLTSELQRIKIELGYNALTLSALPYAIDGITQIFEQIVAVYLQSGELNSSSTPIGQVMTVPPSPQLVTLTLINTPTKIVQGDRLVVDQDGAQESTHAQVVTASTVQVALVNAHQGTYPITVEGGESTARYYLRQCMATADRIARSGSRAGVKKVGEVEFYASLPTQKSPFDELLAQQRYWRSELGRCLGIQDLRQPIGSQGGGGGGVTTEAF